MNLMIYFINIILVKTCYSNPSIYLEFPSSILNPHIRPINALIVLSNGDILSCSVDKRVVISNSSGHTIDQFKQHYRMPTSLAELVNGDIAIGYHDGVIIIWKRSDIYFRVGFHSDRIRSLLALPSGDLVSSSRDMTIKIWNGDRYGLKFTFQNMSCLSMISLNRNQTFACSTLENPIFIIDLNKYEVVSALRFHTGPVLSLAVLDNGHLVSGSFDKTICIWDINTGSVKKILHELNHSILSLVSLSGSTLASGHLNGYIAIWNTETENIKALLRDGSNAIRYLGAMKSGDLISGSGDENLKIWKKQSTYFNKTINLQSKEVTFGAVSATGLLYVTSNFGPVQIWDVHNKIVTCLNINIGIKEAIIELTNGDLAFGATDNTIKVLDQKTMDEKFSLYCHKSLVISLCSLADGRLVSLDIDGTIKIWDETFKKILNTLYPDEMCHRHSVYGLPSNDLLILCQRSYPIANSIQVLDSFEGSLKLMIDDTYAIYSLVVLNDGNIAVSTDDKSIKIYDSVNGSLVKTLLGHTDLVLTMISLPDGKLVTGSIDKKIKVWDLENNSVIDLFIDLDDYATSLALLPDGYLASYTKNKIMYLFNYQNNSIVNYFEVVDNLVQSITVLDDSNVILGFQNGEVSIIDINTEKISYNFKAHNSSITTVGLLENGDLLTIATEKTLKIWDLQSYLQNSSVFNDTLISKPMRNFYLKHNSKITSFLHQTDQLIIADSNGHILLMNTSQNNIIQDIEAHSDCVNSLVFLKESLIVSSSNDGTVKYWNFKNNNLTLLETISFDITPNLLLTINNEFLICSFSDKSVRKIINSSNIVLYKHSQPITSLLKLNNKYVLSGSYDGTIKVWSLEENVLKLSKERSSQTIAMTSFKNGNVITCSLDNKINVWVNHLNNLYPKNISNESNRLMNDSNFEDSLKDSLFNNQSYDKSEDQ